MSDQLPNLPNKTIPDLTDLLYLVEPGIEPLGSFNISIAQFFAGIVQNIYLNFSNPVTVANTAVETNLLAGIPDRGSQTLAAGSVQTAQWYRHIYRGTFGAVASPTVTFRLKLGGTTIGTFPVVVNTAAVGWELRLDTLIVGGGVGGSIFLPTSGVLFSTNGTGAAQLFQVGGGATAINFSIAQQWQLSAQWSVAAAADSLSFEFGGIDVANV